MNSCKKTKKLKKGIEISIKILYIIRAIRIAGVVQW